MASHPFSYQQDDGADDFGAAAGVGYGCRYPGTRDSPRTGARAS